MSLKPTFKIANDECIYLTEKWICNGHWAILRDVAKCYPGVPKPLINILNYQNGSYRDGIKNGPSGENTPDIDAIIPKDLSDYVGVFEQPENVCFRGDEIEGYIFKSMQRYKDAGVDKESFLFGVGDKYVPLMRLGTPMVKDATAPIIIKGSDDLVIGVVMPRRL